LSRIKGVEVLKKMNERRWKLGFTLCNMKKGVEVLEKMNEFGFKKVE
jgi:hypothetical protein